MTRDRRRIEHVFLDEGDVICDNRIRGPWIRDRVGEHFSKLLGGSAEAWSEFNMAAAEHADLAYWEQLAAGKRPETDLWREYWCKWLRYMASGVGVSVPFDDDECLPIARSALHKVFAAADAPLPGAIDAIRFLSSRYALSTASNKHSEMLGIYLDHFGVANCFEHLYGCDLVLTGKQGGTFYERIFANAGVDPSTALVVDDKASVLAWAKEAGSMTALVGEGIAGVDADIVVPLLRDLPAALEAMDS